MRGLFLGWLNTEPIGNAVHTVHTFSCSIFLECRRPLVKPLPQEDGRVWVCLPRGLIIDKSTDGQSRKTDKETYRQTERQTQTQMSSCGRGLTKLKYMMYIVPSSLGAVDTIDSQWCSTTIFVLPSPGNTYMHACTLHAPFQPIPKCCQTQKHDWNEPIPKFCQTQKHDWNEILH